MIITILFLLFPVLSLPFLIYGMVKDEKHRFYYSIGLAFILGILAYYINPSEDLDMYRYYLMIDKYRSMDLYTFLANFAYYFEPLFNFSLYFGSKIMSNNLIFFIYVFTGYIMLYYMIFDYMKIKKVNTKWQMIIFVIINCLFIYFHFAHAAIRNIYGIIILALAFYLEFIKNKKNPLTELLYIIPCLFHMSLVFGIVMRLLIKFKSKKINYIFIGALAFYLLAPSLIKIIALAFSNIPVLYKLYEKVDAYLNDPASLLYSYYFFKMAATLLFGYMYLKNKKNHENNYYKAYKYLLLFTIVSVKYEILFQRFCVLTVVMGIPILIDYFKNNYKTKQFKYIFIPCIIISMAFLYLQVDLFFDLDYGNFFNAGVFKNVVSIFIK